MINEICANELEDEPSFCKYCLMDLPFRGCVNHLDERSTQHLIHCSTKPVCVKLEDSSSYSAYSSHSELNLQNDFKKIAARLGSEIIFVNIDAQKYPHARFYFRVASMPALILYFGKNERARRLRSFSYLELTKWFCNETGLAVA